MSYDLLSDGKISPVANRRLPYTIRIEQCQNGWIITVNEYGGGMTLIAQRIAKTFDEMIAELVTLQLLIEGNPVEVSPKKFTLRDDLPPHASGRKGLAEEPTISSERSLILNSYPVTLQDEVLREQICNFQLVNEVTELHLARLLQLAYRWVTR